jgi:SAM-dependent methyltransferase
MASLSTLPEAVKRPVRPARDALIRWSYRGKGRYCPVCGRSSRRFRGFGAVARKDAECVYCGALERHRLVWLFVEKKTDLFDGRPKNVLHVAPEECFEQRFKERLGIGYVTADLSNPRAMTKMDVTDIPFMDRSFDVIYCSHVLEHVVDDRKAMQEFFRVLKDNGWAILLVPIGGERTIEDSAMTDPQERLRVFGQSDHVRLYGRDYAERLREAGFAVEVTGVSDLVDEQAAVEMGLTSASGEIYFCTK